MKMVYLSVRYDQKTINFDLDIKLNQYISEAYVKVNNDIMSSNQKLNQLIKIIDDKDLIVGHEGKFNVLSDGRIVKNLTMMPINYGDLIFLSPEKSFVARKLNLDKVTKREIYRLAYENFEYRPGYVLDISLKNLDNIFHQTVIDCDYVQVSECDPKIWTQDYTGPLKSTLIPVFLKNHSKRYIKYRHLTLFYQNRPLDPELSLIQQHVPLGAKFTVELNDETAEVIKKDVQILVEGIWGKTETVCISSINTIEEVKEKIQEKTGCPIRDQRLIYGGFQLEDSMKIYKTSIEECSTIHLVLRLRGGMLHETSGKSNFENVKSPKLEYYFQSKSKKIKLSATNTMLAVKKICQVLNCHTFKIFSRQSFT